MWAMGGMSRAPGQGVVANLCVNLPERPDSKPHPPPPSFPQWAPAPVVARYEEDAAALSWRWQQSQCLAAGEGEQVVAGGREEMRLKEVEVYLEHMHDTLITGLAPINKQVHRPFGGQKHRLLTRYQCRMLL